MRMTRNEKLAEKIALLLLSLPEKEIDGVSNDALDLAKRVKREWLVLTGKPYYTKRLASLSRAFAEKQP